MVLNRRVHRRLGRGAALLALLVALGAAAPASEAAGPPVVGEFWAASVFSGSAHLQAEINPNGLATTFHIDYIDDAAYQANLNASEPGFTGADRLPASVEAIVGSGSSPIVAVQLLFSLTPDTVYHYRVVAQNSGGGQTTGGHTFLTRALGGGVVLPDSRSWEMVSPVDKNGGEIDPPGSLAGGGVLQAAADGQSVTYGSAASFGAGAEGAATASQYIGSRSAAGWTTENITTPLYSGSYGSGQEGVPYQLFSGDLARGLLLNGRHCRGEGSNCAVPNAPLAGTGAPIGYQNFYLRDNGAASFAALLGDANATALALDPAHFELSLAGASLDLRHVVLSTCAALTADAIEIPQGEGCNPAKQNLYLWSSGTGLTLVNLLPAQTVGTPGATLGAQSAAISTDGSRVYWTDLATGNLYLRAGGQTTQVDPVSGGVFETATPDGSTAFYTKSGHLFRYEAVGDVSTDLTPSGGVQGVLGASEDGSYVYYQSASGLFVWHSGTTTEVAPSGDPSNYPPTTGTARVSSNGVHLLFMATAPLTGYDNKDLTTGLPDSEVYLYDANADARTCVSCNPTLGRPSGPSEISGAIANGEGPEATDSYKPRSLSADGRRVYFQSADALAITDTNGQVDVYQWEAQGTGSCSTPAGCVALISDGRTTVGATFVDASSDGSNAFFLTNGSLVKGDLVGSTDLYDARVGGGFPESPPPLACDGDACQSLPPAPIDPTLTTRLKGPGNPPVHYPKQRRHCKGGFIKRKGKCVRAKTSQNRHANRHSLGGGR